ncbi:MAG: hypothetical protein HFJ94_01850 [Muribaculaceae bacterium]|nr:hypothetical protein [Muribaculaceae bacterium]
MKNITIKAKWYEILSGQSDALRAQVFFAVIQYIATGQVIEMSEAASAAFAFIRYEIDAAATARAKRLAAKKIKARQAEAQLPHTPPIQSEPIENEEPKPIADIQPKEQNNPSCGESEPPRIMAIYPHRARPVPIVPIAPPHRPIFNEFAGNVEQLVTERGYGYGESDPHPGKISSEYQILSQKIPGMF